MTDQMIEFVTTYFAFLKLFGWGINFTFII